MVDRLKKELKKLLKNWRLKAAILRLLSVLPEDLGSRLHYIAQSRLGALRRIEPWTRLEGAVKASRFLEGAGRTIRDARVLEIGTGWRLNAPLAFSLMGAERVVTVDLRTLLRPDLILKDLQLIVENEEKLREILGSFPLNEQRWNSLKELAQGDDENLLSALEKNLGIVYLAPQDASQLNEFNQGSFDLHFSQNTFEHIPSPTLTKIMREALRLLDKRGLAIHGIDQSDHFSHFDKSISSANFLKYDDASWNRVAGNRFTYVNRLRASEYRALFKEIGFEILEEEKEVDPRAFELIDRGSLIPDPKFSRFSAEEAAVRYSWLVGESPACPLN